MIGCGVIVGLIIYMPEVKLGWFGKLVVEKVKDRLENIAAGERTIAWYG
jgi:hypothetical protein